MLGIVDFRLKITTFRTQFKDKSRINKIKPQTNV